MNWRIRAIDAFERELADELHYTSVVTIARNDALQIKEAIIKAIENVRGLVKESKEDELFCYSFDFFRV